MYMVRVKIRSLLPSLYKAIDSGDEYFPMGSGEQIRDFVHVSEVAVQLLRLACSNNAKGSTILAQVSHALFSSL